MEETCSDKHASLLHNRIANISSFIVQAFAVNLTQLLVYSSADATGR